MGFRFCRPRSSCIPKPVFDCKVVGNSLKTLTKNVDREIGSQSKTDIHMGRSSRIYLPLEDGALTSI